MSKAARIGPSPSATIYTPFPRLSRRWISLGGLPANRQFGFANTVALGGTFLAPDLFCRRLVGRAGVV